MLARRRRRFAATAVLLALASASGCADDRCRGEASCTADADRCGDAHACTIDRAASSYDAGRDARAPDAARPRRAVPRDESCAVQSVRAERGRRPVDAVFVVDNSGSMSEEIAAVRESLEQDFAAIIDESGVDLRVILISRFGQGGTDVCIEPPLGGAPCADRSEPAHGARFFHYDQLIGSFDSLCYLLATFDQPDEAGRVPEGWQAWLRPESEKAFVIVSDDSARCAYRERGREIAFGAGRAPEEDALLFHETLLAKSPAQFGAPPDVRYRLFSIVGIASNGAPGEPLLPHQPLSSTMCDTAMTPGLSYQAISVATDALRYPVCEGRSFDRVFRVLARSVVEASSADCAFDLPDESGGDRGIDLHTVSLEFRAVAGAPATQFIQVPERGACDELGSFYIDEQVRLCPSACALVKRAETPQIELSYGCELTVR